MQYMVQKRNFPNYMTAAASLTILTGLYLLHSVYGSFFNVLFTTVSGLSISLGAFAAIITFIIGMAVQRPTAMKIGAMGAKMQASDGPPAEELVKEMKGLQMKAAKAAHLMAGLNTIAVIGMGLSRYI